MVGPQRGAVQAKKSWIGHSAILSGRTTDGQRIGVVAVQSRVARVGNGAAKVACRLAIIGCTKGHLRLLPRN